MDLIPIQSDLEQSLKKFCYFSKLKKVDNAFNGEHFWTTDIQFVFDAFLVCKTFITNQIKEKFYVA